MRAKTIKLVENIRENLCDLGLNKDFLNVTKNRSHKKKLITEFHEN